VVEELPRHVTGKLLRRFLRGEDVPASSDGGTEP
jgi:acyl-coenzyme A synthetase/AMP-(fatty) acid ligase